MLCNHGVGSSNLPRSTNHSKGLNPNCAVRKKYKLVQPVPYNKAWATFEAAFRFSPDTARVYMSSVVLISA